MKWILILIASTLLSACFDKKLETASPNCADFDKATDSVQKAELLRKCPRIGPAFKPSEKKEW